MTFFDKLAKISKNNISDQAHFQNWCGTIAMVLSCAAFTGSVALNKGIPSEQKEFLVSQELADGAINVALFWVMTDKFKKWADKKIVAGHIFPKEMKEKVEKVRALVGAKGSLKDMSAHFTADELTKIGKFHSGFKNGVSLVGSLFAASIITPIVRNIVASTFQKRVDFQKKPLDKTKPMTAQVASLSPIVLSPKPYASKPQGFQGGMRI